MWGKGSNLGEQEDGTGLQGFRTKLENWPWGLPQPASTWASPRSPTQGWASRIAVVPDCSFNRRWLCSGQGPFSQAPLSTRAGRPRTYYFCRSCRAWDGDLAGGSGSRGSPSLALPVLKVQNIGTHLGIWVPCLPAWLLFSPELVPPSHPLTAPLHKKATKPRGEHIYLIWGWGIAVSVRVYGWLGRQPEGLLPWSKRLFWPQAGVGSRLRGRGRCVKGGG